MHLILFIVLSPVSEDYTVKFPEGPEWEEMKRELAAIGEEIMRTTGPERLRRTYELLGRMRGE